VFSSIVSISAFLAHLAQKSGSSSDMSVVSALANVALEKLPPALLPSIVIVLALRCRILSISSSQNWKNRIYVGK